MSAGRRAGLGQGRACAPPGSKADLPHAVDDVLAGLEEPLAYVLREGVTNVVRHSGAHRCTVRLGAAPGWRLRDDGTKPRGVRFGRGPVARPATGWPGWNRAAGPPCTATLTAGPAVHRWLSTCAAEVPE